MFTSPDFRLLLAATALLALFASAYEVAVWRPSQLPATVVGPAGEAAAADSAGLGGPAAPDTPTQPATPIPAAEPVETPEPYRDPRPIVERGSWWARRPRLLHHYVGTVGGQPATVLLEWQNPDSVSGSFYLHRQGPAHRLVQLPPPDPARPHPRHRGQVLELWWGKGEWQLHGRPGATLKATWRDGPTGRPQAVVMRESYAGAVRLAVQTEWVHGRATPNDPDGHVHSSVSWVKYEFLHLPDPAAVPPALCPLLSPGPAARRRLLLEGGDYDCRTSHTVSVRLNDFGLLSYQYAEECSPIAGGYGLQYRNALLDLQAGRWLAPESQLQPNYQVGLARLLARHLLHDEFYQEVSRDRAWRRQLTPYLGARPDTLAAATRWALDNASLSVEPALFTGGGLELEYQHPTPVNGLLYRLSTLYVSYAELRPLVRPGTPLARMLRARGLW